MASGGGSVAPTTTALASPRRMASIPSLRQTPKVEHAATGAKARPVMWPSMEICEAGVFQMFHTRFADTALQGGWGSCQRSWSCRSWRCFSLSTLTLPRSMSPWTLSDSIWASSRR